LFINYGKNLSVIGDATNRECPRLTRCAVAVDSGDFHEQAVKVKVWITPVY